MGHKINEINGKQSNLLDMQFQWTGKQNFTSLGEKIPAISCSEKYTLNIKKLKHQKSEKDKQCKHYPKEFSAATLE